MSITLVNDRGRPLCRDLDCDVEVAKVGKYCSAHDWVVNRWLEKSRRQLEEYKRKAAERKAA